MSRTSAPAVQRARRSVRNGAVSALLLPIRQDQQDGRRVRRTDEIEDQRRAVGVAPLGVVDADDHRPPRGQRRQQGPARAERAPTHPLRIEDGLGCERADARDASQHGEQAPQRRHVLGPPEGPLGVGKVHQVSTERIDDAVDGLVRHRLPLVRLSSKHDRLAPLDQAVEKVLEQGRLAHARSTAHAHGRPAARARDLERVAQRADVRLAPDERRVASAGGPAAHALGAGRRRDATRGVAAEAARIS